MLEERSEKVSSYSHREHVASLYSPMVSRKAAISLVSSFWTELTIQEEVKANLN